jgi:hypothetical protein
MSPRNITPAPKRERRRDKRSRTLKQVSGEEVASGRSVRVRDLSRQAFSVESASSFVIGRQYEFRFPGLDGSPVLLRGTAKRCERGAITGGVGGFVAGFEFEWKTPKDRSDAERAVRKLGGSF